ncbi:MAG: proteasome subunit alpha [Leptospirillum sp.]|jgi:proteasome beta subunit
MKMIEPVNGSSGSFLDLLKQQSGSYSSAHAGEMSAGKFQEIQATTILSFHFSEGVLVAGDRRATAGNRIMANRVEKVIEIDGRSVLAISGSPAQAIEMARVLDHSFRYYRRTQLEEMSLEGRLRLLAQLLKENLPMAMNGVGGVVPLFITFDPESNEPRIYFYDILGAHFEGTPFAVGGSGSLEVQGILRFLDRWGTSGGLSSISKKDAIVLSLRLLETASYFDSATGGIQAGDRIYPVVKLVSGKGVETVGEDFLKEMMETEVRGV